MHARESSWLRCLTSLIGRSIEKHVTIMSGRSPRLDKCALLRGRCNTRFAGRKQDGVVIQRGHYNERETTVPIVNLRLQYLRNSLNASQHPEWNMGLWVSLTRLFTP